MVAAWIAGSFLVAPANRAVGPPPQTIPVSRVTIQSDSGSLLAGWYASAENAQATLVLLHAIRADKRSMVSRAEFLHDSGYSILMIDLQAHGESPGKNITAGYLERHDVRAAVEWVRNRNPSHKIGVLGRSLGGAAALLASPLAIDALVLESVYPTIEEAVNNRLAMRIGPLSYAASPFLLCQLQPRLGISPSSLRPIDHVAQTDCPLLIASGDQDQRTTLAETQRLFDTAKEPKQLSIFEGVAHSDLLAKNPEQYKNDIISFLKAHLEPADN